MLVGYALLLLGTFVFASATCRRPSAALILNGLGFTLLATGVVCVGRGRLRLADDLQAGARSPR